MNREYIGNLLWLSFFSADAGFGTQERGNRKKYANRMETKLNSLFFYKVFFFSLEHRISGVCFYSTYEFNIWKILLR